MGKLNKTDREWQRELSPEEFRIARQKVLNLRLRGNTGTVNRTGYIPAVAVVQNCFLQRPNTIAGVAGQAFSVRLIQLL